MLFKEIIININNLCVLSGQSVVNHTVNFVEPPKHLPPIWVPAGRFSPECLDKQWEDALPPNMEPIRYHTQHIERSWRELKLGVTAQECQPLTLANGCTVLIF